jgi:hypothetical protein
MSTVVSRSVLSKTVGIFAGITHKNLKLEDAPEPSTDGTVIRVPHDSPDSYELLEKELARVVFHSDALVRQAFVDEYVAKMGVLAQRHNVAIEEANIGYLVGGIFDVLEAYRVLTLWSKIYPGSAGRIEDLQRAAIHQALTAHTAGGAEPSVLNGLLATSHGVPYDLGALENLRPYLAEALQKVERRSAKATLLVSRWLVSSLVNQLIRDALGLPPPSKGTGSGSGKGQGSKGRSGTGDAQGAGSSGAPEEPPPDPNDQSPPEEDPQGQQDPASPEPQDTNNPGDNKRPPQGSESQDDTDAEGDGDPPGQSEREQPQAPPPPSKQKEPRPEPWHPPPVQSLPREKLQALNDLANNKAGTLPDQARRSVGDVEPPPMATPEARDSAEEQAKNAGNVNTNDPAALDEKLNETTDEAEKQIEELEKALQSQITDDDWLTKEIADVVHVQDVRTHDLPRESLAAMTALSNTDEQAVKRLRLLFGRVKGRAERALDHDGTEVDIEAFIERRVNKDNRPVFRGETRGRGFKCILLIDRSGTMTGEKTAQAERAYRLLRAALKFPFVDLRVWGFNSMDYGRTTLYRFDPDMPCFSTPRSPVGGFTPLHTGIDLAAKELRRGTERKVLFVLSDGFPEHFNAEGQAYGRKQLLDLVRLSVKNATASGVRVVGTFIGDIERARLSPGPTGRGTHPTRYEAEEDAALVTSVSYEHIAYMFGPPKNWKVLDPRTLGDALVALVTDTFVDYLRSG